MRLSLTVRGRVVGLHQNIHTLYTLGICLPILRTNTACPQKCTQNNDGPDGVIWPARPDGISGGKWNACFLCGWSRVCHRKDLCKRQALFVRRHQNCLPRPPRMPLVYCRKPFYPCCLLFFFLSILWPPCSGEFVSVVRCCSDACMLLLQGLCVKQASVSAFVPRVVLVKRSCHVSYLRWIIEIPVWRTPRSTVVLLG